MKILICGSGSIATRHYKNLLSLGYKDIIFYKSTKFFRSSKLKKKLIFYNLKDALNEKPDVAFICNITSMHVTTAIECAKKNCHLFIEKPISNNLRNIQNLKKIIRKNNLFLFVAYMIRFHPLIKKIKALIENKKKTKIFYATSIWGEYLPGWHPKENYKKSYASNKNLGGGVRLTLSHDLDLMCYLFGKIESMKRLDKYNSNLKINVDVGSTYLIKFKSGVDCTIHINYLSNPPIRDLKILGENIQIFFDYYKSKLKIIEKKKEKILKIKNFKRNDMFIEELKYFFKCLKLKRNFHLESDFDLIKFLI